MSDYLESAKGRSAVGSATATIQNIESYEKEYQQWERRGEAVVKRYRDERNEASNARVTARKYNILWANTETLRPSLYARAPTVQVERRFKDSDPVGRVASEIAERAGQYLVETSDYDAVMKAVVEDYLLPGRAIAWINYKADFSDPEGPMDGEETEETPEQKAEETPLDKVREMVVPIYVGYKDFGHSPVRTWQEVTQCWRVCHMNREKLVARFGSELGNKLPLDRHKEAASDTGEVNEDTSSIYEVFDKARRKVCWIHKSETDYLEEVAPPVDLQGFWPFPRPLWSTSTNDTLIPIPLYALYQDQAAELDKITNRIARLTDGLKLAGVYDASIPELQRILSPHGAPDNMLIPVSNYAGLREKGGVRGSIELVPLDLIAATLMSLYEARQQVLGVIYQVTGLSDIIRGESNPNETARAQSIKSQFASLRIKDAQAEVARFAKDLIAIMVETAVEMYEPQTLYDMVMAASFIQLSPREQQEAQMLQQAGMPVPPPKEQFEAALKLLRDDRMRSFHIDIETDSTVALNDQEEKNSVTEFLTAFGGFISNFGPMIKSMPALAPVAGEALLFATRRYRAGRLLENTIEQAVAQLTQQASQPAPDPEVQKAQAEMAAEQQKTQAEMQLAQAKIQSTMQVKSAELTSDVQVKNNELSAEAQMHQQDLAFKAAEAQKDREAELQRFIAKLEQERVIEEMKISAENERTMAAPSIDIVEVIN